MAKRKKYYTLLINTEDAIKRFPELKEEIEDGLDFIKDGFDEDGLAFCLHCDERIALKDMKAGINCDAETNLSIPELNEVIIYWCPTNGCDSGFMDWKKYPWPTSKGYEKYEREHPDWYQKYLNEN